MHPQRHQEYTDFLREYLTLGHMELKLPDADRSIESVYLPYHAVIKEASKTTRRRVVFDASTKGRNGTSLNDHLMVGPKVQEDMFSLLMRFRTNDIAFTADIQKMYGQIRVHEADTKYQKYCVARDIRGANKGLSPFDPDVRNCVSAEPGDALSETAGSR